MIGNLMRTTCSAINSRMFQASVKQCPKGFLKNVEKINNNSNVLGKPALPPKPAGLSKNRQPFTPMKSFIVSVNNSHIKSEQSFLSQPHQQGAGRKPNKLDLSKFAKIIECEKAKTDGRHGVTAQQTKVKAVEVKTPCAAVASASTGGGQSQSTKALSPTVSQKNEQGAPPPPPWLDVLPTIRQAPQPLENSAKSNSVSGIKYASKPSRASGEKLFSANLMSELKAKFEALAEKKRTPQQ